MTNTGPTKFGWKCPACHRVVKNEASWKRTHEQHRRDQLIAAGYEEATTDGHATINGTTYRWMAGDWISPIAIRAYEMLSKND